MSSAVAIAAAQNDDDKHVIFYYTACSISSSRQEGSCERAYISLTWLSKLADICLENNNTAIIIRVEMIVQKKNIHFTWTDEWAVGTVGYLLSTSILNSSFTKGTKRILFPKRKKIVKAYVTYTPFRLTHGRKRNLS